VKWSEYEAKHLSPSTAEVKNVSSSSQYGVVLKDRDFTLY
jgi:hypothetical protein